MQLFSLFNVLGKWGRLFLQGASFYNYLHKYLDVDTSLPIFAIPKSLTHERKRAPEAWRAYLLQD
jgi:hypothetical protein